MKRNDDLRSLEEDWSVILANYIHWNHFYGHSKRGVFAVWILEENAMGLHILIVEL